MLSTDALISEMELSPPRRIKAPAIFLSSNDQGVPMAMLHNIRHNEVMHDPVGLLTIMTEDRPYVPHEQRLEVHTVGQGIYRVIVHSGFKQRPNLPYVIEQCRQQNLNFGEASLITYFLSRVTLDIGSEPSMARWRKILSATLLKNADDPSRYFHIRPNQVVEIGTRLEI